MKCITFLGAAGIIIIWAWRQDARGSFCNLCSLWLIYCALVGIYHVCVVI